MAMSVNTIMYQCTLLIWPRVGVGVWVSLNVWVCGRVVVFECVDVIIFEFVDLLVHVGMWVSLNSATVFH